MTIGQEKALLAADLEKFSKGVDALMKVPLSANQKAALVSFSYNVGLHNLAHSLSSPRSFVVPRRIDARRCAVARHIHQAIAPEASLTRAAVAAQITGQKRGAAGLGRSMEGTAFTRSDRTRDGRLQVSPNGTWSPRELGGWNLCVVSSGRRLGPALQFVPGGRGSDLIATICLDSVRWVRLK